MTGSPSHLSGIVWSGVNACSAVLMPMGMFVFFARTATPEMIGAVVVAVSCIEILKSFALPGLYEAVLQQAEDQARCHETMSFVLLLLASALLFAWLLALIAVRHFVPAATAHFVAFAALGTRVVLDLASLQPQARLAQRLAYRRLAIRTMISISVGGAIGIALALLADPFIGLVGYQIAQSFAFLLSTVIGTRAAARPRLHVDCFRRMWREATLATGVRLLAASVNNLDQIVAAVLFGSAPLAFYNLGKRIETIFVTAAGSFSTILFQPLFARAGAAGRDDLLFGGVSILTIALGLPAAAFIPNSSLVVTGVFGPQWTGASAIAAVMALAGFVRAVGYVPGALMSVTVRNRELLAVSLASVSGAALLMTVLAPFGIIWCAVALLVMHLGILGWMATIVRDKAKRPARDYFAGLVAPFVLMMVGAESGRLLLDGAVIAHGAVGDLLRIAGSATAGAAVGACYFAFHFRRQLALRFAMPRVRPVPRP